jgi:hypothetical protein
MFGRAATVPIGTVAGVDAELLEPKLEQPPTRPAARTTQATRVPHDCRDHALDVSCSASLTFSGTLVDSPEPPER